MQTQITQGYWSTADLCTRLRVSKRTISRMMLRENNPLPNPCFHGAGTSNKWEISDVMSWEDRERELIEQRAA